MPSLSESLSGVIKQASRGADLYFVFRFLRLLTMSWKKTDAYKYKIIDAKGNALKKSSELESVDEKAAYTMLHRMVFKIRRLIEKIPLIGKSILLNYAAALFLLKEQNDKQVWTDENYMERKLMEFLESDWEEEAGQLKEVFRGQYGLTQANEFLTERTMTDGEKEKREEIVLSMKKKSSELKAKYGDDWENIMYATATKQAMGENITADKGRNMRSFTEFQLDEIKFEAGKVYHQDTNDGPLYFKAGEQQKNKKWKGLVLDIGKKKPKNGSADETLRFWKATPDSDVPPALKEAVQVDEDAKMGKQSDDQLRKLYKTASEKDQSSPANKSFTKRVAKEMKKRGIQEEVEQLVERKGYSNFSPFPQKVLTDFAKRAKKAGLDWDQYKKFVKQTFKDGADENNHYIWGRDVFFPKGKQPAIGEAVEQLVERKGYSNLIPFPQKVLVDFAKRVKKAGLDFDQYKKFVKQTFKDGADERNAYIFGRDVYYPTGKQPAIGEAVEIDESTKEYAKSLEKIARDKQMSMISKSDKDNLLKIAALLDKERKEGVEIDEVVDEEAPANTVGGGNVAGLGVGPQGEPGVHPKKKKKKLAWEDSRVLMNKFAGKDVFIVDSDMFHDCRMGKKKYHRYEKYVGTQRVGNAIREYGRKFPGRPIILQNGESGPMLYLRYGRS